MAINLTTPETIPDVEYQGITKLDFFIPHYRDSADGSIKIDKAGIQVVWIVTTWSGAGEVIRENRYTEVFSNWPAVFVTDVRAVYDRVEQYSINQGYIGAGTGEAL